MKVEELFRRQAEAKAERKKEQDASQKDDDNKSKNSSPTLNGESIRDIEDLVEKNQVVVFSKSYCPFCRQAKSMLKSIDGLEFVTIEMDDGAHNGWQSYISGMAKEKPMYPEQLKNFDTKSVPQIFINQKYVGGADDLADMYTDKRLAEILGRSTA